MRIASRLDARASTGAQAARLESSKVTAKILGAVGENSPEVSGHQNICPDGGIRLIQACLPKSFRCEPVQRFVANDACLFLILSQVGVHGGVSIDGFRLELRLHLRRPFPLPSGVVGGGPLLEAAQFMENFRVCDCAREATGADPDCLLRDGSLEFSR